MSERGAAPQRRPVDFEQPGAVYLGRTVAALDANEALPSSSMAVARVSRAPFRSFLEVKRLLYDARAPASTVALAYRAAPA